MIKRRKAITIKDIENHAIESLSYHAAQREGNEAREENDFLFTMPDYQPNPEQKVSFQNKIVRRTQFVKADIILSRVSMALVVLIIAGSIPFFTVTAFREQVLSFFITEDVNVRGTQPLYHPDGFYIGKTEKVKGTENKTIDFIDGKGGFYYYNQYETKLARGAVSADRKRPEKTEINGIPTTFYPDIDGKDTIYLEWENNGYVFWIESNLSKVELTKIAESIT